MTYLAISEGTIVFPTPKLVFKNHALTILFHQEIERQRSYIKKLWSTLWPYCNHHHGHFFSPPSRLQPKPLATPHQQHPWERTHGSGMAKFGQRAKPACCEHRQCSKLTVVDPPNCLRTAHILIALPTAAAKTEQQDNANRSIGWTYCIGTAAEGPYMATGIVAWNHIVVFNAPCT